MKLAMILTTALLLSACATSGKINSVSLGMSKPQVIAIMGKPVSTSAQQGVEYLNYALSETDDQALAGVTRSYFIRIIDGKVESYGRTGDFNSTQKPVTHIEVKQTQAD